MSMDLAKKEFSTSPEYFIAGTITGIETKVKVAGEALAAHAPVLLGEDGKVTAIAAPTAEAPLSLTGLYGITSEAAKANEEVVIYLTGEFFADGLVLPTGVVAGDVEVPMRNIGIFLK